MIKFFRHIRRSLIHKNQMGKYFKYAIGEILLVVIGILIALQINNWNEQRKLKTEELELLTNLKQSFQGKLTELKRLNTDRNEHLKINKKLADYAKADTIPEVEMFTMLSQLYTWYAVNEEFSVINMLFSSGKINTISNDSLKAKLITWPDLMEEMLEEQRVLQNLVTQRLNLVTSKYVPSLNLYTSLFAAEVTAENHVESNYANDFKGLLNNRAFESLVGEKSIYLMTNIRDTKILISEAKSILRLIDQDLND